jgi:hypothetical protein
VGDAWRGAGGVARLSTRSITHQCGPMENNSRLLHQVWLPHAAPNCHVSVTQFLFLATPNGTSTNVSPEIQTSECDAAATWC